MSDVIMVKVAKLGATAKDVALSPGKTVQDAINTAGIDSARLEVRHNGTRIEDLSATVRDGDTILLVPQVKGGSDVLMVKVANLGATAKDVALSPGKTVQDAINTAGIDSARLEVRHNGARIEDLSVPVRDGDTILLVPQVKGGVA